MNNHQTKAVDPRTVLQTGKEYSLQETFDFIVLNARKQGKRCTNPAGDTCLYADGKGNHCAFGWVINPALNDVRGSVISVESFATASGVSPVLPEFQSVWDSPKGRDFFNVLQRAHDSSYRLVDYQKQDDMRIFESGAREIADSYGLTFPEPSEEIVPVLPEPAVTIPAPAPTPKRNAPAELLKNALELIKDKANWTAGCLFKKTLDGIKVECPPAEADCYCVNGALFIAGRGRESTVEPMSLGPTVFRNVACTTESEARNITEYAAARYLAAAALHLYDSSAWYANDMFKHPAALAMLQLAIKYAEQKRIPDHVRKKAFINGTVFDTAWPGKRDLKKKKQSKDQSGP